MKQRIASIFARLRKPGSNAGRADSVIAATSQRDERESACALAAGLDRAMELGLWAHAERIAASAARIADRHPMLCERIVRLRLEQKNPEAALNFLDYCQVQTVSLRLLRSICLLQLGRRIEAHLELRAWARRPSAPFPARILLGLLEWHAGDADAACDALQQNLKQLEDPHTLGVLMMLFASRQNFVDAAWSSERLRHSCIASEDAARFNAMLSSLGFAPLETEDASSNPEREEFLAAELLSAEATIPALVEAQQRQLNPAAARTLANAIERALPDLENQVQAYAAIANLLRLLDEQTSALELAHRGLSACPMSMTLARLVVELQSELDEQNQTADEHVTEMMRERAA